STMGLTRRGTTSSSPAVSPRRWLRLAPVRPIATRRWVARERTKRLRVCPWEPRFSRHGSLAIDWVEVFAPVVFEAYRPRAWPASDPNASQRAVSAEVALEDAFG